MVETKNTKVLHRDQSTTPKLKKIGNDGAVQFPKEYLLHMEAFIS